MRNNKNVLVSIIIPVYNGSEYMREAIDSALSQTYKNIEVIVINDGSNDNGKTDEIAKSYGKKIRYFSKENGGVATALNLGIEKMEGEYFSWLSHDDVYLPEKVSEQMEIMNKYKTPVIIYSDYIKIDSENLFLEKKEFPDISGEGFRLHLTINNMMNGCSFLIPKECFKEAGVFNKGLKTTQDYDMWFRLAEIYSFIHIPKSLMKMRIHKRQTTNLISDVVLKECNDLMISFTEKLSSAELKLYSGKRSVILSYLRLAKNFHNRKFFKARNFAFKKALELVLNMAFAFFSIKNRLTKRFRIYYLENTFNSSESRSGEGSTLRQTKIVRAELPKILKCYGVETLLDAPCGDLNWIKETDLSNIKYLGVDIVSEIISENKKKYFDIGEFFCLDIVSDNLPLTDMIMSRDCLVHLTFSEAKKAIKNMKRSGSKYLFTTSFTDREINEELKGEWRPLNLEKPPFNFPIPLLILNEGCTEADSKFKDKSLCLWEFKDIEIK